MQNYPCQKSVYLKKCPLPRQNYFPQMPKMQIFTFASLPRFKFRYFLLVPHNVLKGVPQHSHETRNYFSAGRCKRTY